MIAIWIHHFKSIFVFLQPFVHIMIQLENRYRGVTQHVFLWIRQIPAQMFTVLQMFMSVSNRRKYNAQ